MGTTTSGETIFEFYTGFIYLKPGKVRLVTASDYTGQVILTGRPVLPIKYSVIVNDIGDTIYTIIMGDQISKEIKIVLTLHNNMIKITEGDNIAGISAVLTKDVNNLNDNLEVKILKGSPFKECTYKIGDKYLILFGQPSNNNTETYFDIHFSRSNRVVDGDSCKFPKQLSNLYFNDTIVPSIDINFQSLIDGSDIGNTVFTIIDKVNYYNHKTTPIIPNYTCKTLYTNDPKPTIFNKSCPLITNILKGKGNSAYEKIVYLMENVVIDQNDAYDFALLLVKYSMLKYILSRLMYGNFNINYVLNKYNKKFIKDLSNTRFCKFLYDFTNPNSDIFGFNKYFL